jgi:hypothetical protein
VLVAALADVSWASVGFQQDSGPDGIFSIEAENYGSKTAREGHSWTLSTNPDGYSGKGLMTASPDDGESSDIGEGPSLNFEIDFVKTGTHYLWVRGYGIGSGDSCHAALDGRGFAEKIEMLRQQWSWVNETDNDGAAKFQISQPGVHTVSILMREDGASVDRILITTNPDYRPERFGPAGFLSGGVMAFAGSGSSGLEADTEIVIPVTLTTFKESVFSVDYSIAGGTADSSDYQLKPGTLTFKPGQIVKNIRLSIVKDGIDEEDETVVVKLSNPKGPDARLGAITEHSYKVIDPRPVVEFESALSGVSEQDGSVDVTVRLTAAYDKTVTVDYAVTGGSATKGLDYTLGSGGLRFAPRELTKSIKVVIKTDNVKEVTETIELKLSNAVNAKLSGRTTHSVNICERSYARLGGAYYYRYDSGQPWEKFAKVGRHPDVMVRIGGGDDKLVFWRGSSYLPFLEADGRKWFVEELVARSGDGEGLMHDKINQYSHIRIVEDSPARSIVEWRYIPDFDKPGLENWTEEYFVVYPDGICYRSVKEGTETLEQWQDPAYAVVQHLLLTDKGICPMPKSWTKGIKLAVDKSVLSRFSDLRFDRVKGSYTLEAKSSGVAAKISFKVASDVTNPALFVKGWGDAGVKVSVDSVAFDGFKVGYAKKMDNDDLVVWFDKEFKAGSSVVIEPVGGSAPVVRAPVRDPYSSKVPLFPESSVDPGPFGAFYTTLKYWTEWDDPWRVGEYADVVVQFDKSTDRFIFWRGTTNVPHWVNELNRWYGNEFVERRAGDAGLPGGCAEPMQDHESRYSNVRIIQSNDARVIVHWRYAPCDGNYDHPFVDETGWGDWVDEYYYVYPDETCVRDAKLYTSVPNKFNEWHEAIPLVNPGMIPEDCIDMQALSMANAAGKAKVFDFEKGFPPNSEFEDGYNIILVGMKGKGKPFAICESAGQWFDPISRPGDTRFNHYDDWPAWPAKYRRKDWERNPMTNYREFWRFLPSHSSLMHLDWDNYESDLDGPVVSLRKILLNGMTGINDVTSLVPLARYWENSPVIKVTGYGFSGAIFDKSQKAYKIDRRICWIDSMVNRDDDKMVNKDADKVDLQVLASNESPIINPCFIINNWPENAKAKLYINGKESAEGKDFRQGIETNWGEWESTSSLVIWVRSNSEETVNFTIEMVK